MLNQHLPFHWEDRSPRTSRYDSPALPSLLPISNQICSFSLSPDKWQQGLSNARRQQGVSIAAQRFTKLLADFWRGKWWGEKEGGCVSQSLCSNVRSTSGPGGMWWRMLPHCGRGNLTSRDTEAGSFFIPLCTTWEEIRAAVAWSHRPEQGSHLRLSSFIQQIPSKLLLCWATNTSAKGWRHRAISDMEELPEEGERKVQNKSGKSSASCCWNHGEEFVTAGVEREIMEAFPEEGSLELHLER